MGCPSTVSRKPKTAVRPNAKRKGCWTCKRYHRKCDESLPFCQRCVEYGTECEGYGAQRIAFRIHIPQNKQASSPEVGGNGILVANRRQSLPRSPSTPSPIITLPSTQQLLLVDFLQGFAATKAISPQHNFYRDDIAPLVGEYPHVRSAALALTTAYKKPGDTAEAFKHYQHAVQAFLTSQGRSNKLQANLASIFLLAWFEILVFDPEKWMMHLRGAAMLINRHAKELWQTTFGRRLIHAMARLDCPNSMSGRAPSTLDPQVYELLGRDDNPVEQINSEEYLIDACRRLHGIMGAATCISDEWVATPCPVGTSSVTFRERNTNVLQRLDAWYENLPGALKWKGNIDAMNQQPKLLRVILLQYFATRVHVYHMLDPQRSGLWHDSVDLAKRCLALIKGLGSPNSVDQSHFHGDMSMAFVLAVIGVLIDDDNDRRWIKQYLFSLGRETVWCGYERAMCLEAWWESDTPGKRIIMSQPKRENTSWNWKPEMGMNVDILYEDLKSGELKHDSYFFDRTVAGTVFEDGCTTTM